MSNAAVVPTVSPGQRLNVDLVQQDLTLANGMTAGYGVNDGNNDNFPFDPGTYGQWPHQPQRVGYIRNVISLTNGSSTGDGLYTLYFMYNPNQITINWQTNPQQGSPLYLYGQNLSQNASTAAGAGSTQDSSTVPSYATAQTVGWSLYFDRTYDMLYGNPRGANPQDDRGVLKDVAALYNLMGTFIDAGSGSAVPFSTPCEVVFGQNHDGQLFGFTGYISTLTITYGIFRHDMIPSRAEVDITLTATYVPNQAPAAGAGSTAPNPSAQNNPLQPTTNPTQVGAASPTSAVTGALITGLPLT